MSQRPQDRELEELMAEARAVRERYRAVECEEPPPHLDDAIRAAARREARSRPRLAGSPFGSSWRIPLSIAAVVVVSATVTVMVGEQQRHVPEAKAPPPSAAPAPAPSPAAPLPPPAEQSKPDASTSTQTLRRKAAPDARQAVPESRLQSNVEQPEQDRRQPPTSPALEEKSARAAAAPPRRAESEGASANGAPAMADDQARSDEFAEPSAEESPAELRKREDHDVRLTPLSRGAAGQASPEATTKSESALRDSATERAFARKELLARQPAPWEHDPALWLQRIDELRKAGQVAQARTSFEAFRKRFPDYKLPTEFVVPPQ